MFGPIIELKTDTHEIRLAPPTREQMAEFIQDGGMQTHTVTQYLGRYAAPVLEDEYKWFERTRTDKSNVAWSIFVRKGEEWVIIGNTSLENISFETMRMAISGCVIFRKDYWGQGIAKHIHRARTMFAFEQLNLHAVRSAVMSGNEASFKALQGVGYVQVSTERNNVFRNGQLLHKRNLEMINPKPEMWRTWWHGDHVPAAFVAARVKTREALEWAEKYVRLL